MRRITFGFDLAPNDRRRFSDFSSAFNAMRYGGFQAVGICADAVYNVRACVAKHEIDPILRTA